MNLIFKAAHRIAKQLKKEFPVIDYQSQLGINIKCLTKNIKKGDYKMLLENLNLEELKELQKKVNEEIKTKENQNKNKYKFNFEFDNDPRKGTPYAARLSIGEDGKLKREFFDFHKEYGKRVVTVSGTFTAKEDEIIEERQGGSWNNDYRYWFLIKNGEKIKVADIDCSNEKINVHKYLKNEINTDELLMGVN